MLQCVFPQKPFERQTPLRRPWTYVADERNSTSKKCVSVLSILKIRWAKVPALGKVSSCGASDAEYRNLPFSSERDLCSNKSFPVEIVLEFPVTKQVSEPPVSVSGGLVLMAFAFGGEVGYSAGCLNFLHGGAFFELFPMRRKRTCFTSTLALLAASLFWSDSAVADSPSERQRSGRSSTEFKAYQQRLKSRRDAGLSARRQMYGNRNYSRTQLSLKKQINLSNPSGSFVWGYNYKGKNNTRFSYLKDPRWHMLRTPLTPTGDSESINNK